MEAVHYGAKTMFFLARYFVIQNSKCTFKKLHPIWIKNLSINWEYVDKFEEVSSFFTHI